MSRTATPRVITSSALSAVLVLHDGRVVGRSIGKRAPDVPLQLAAGVARPAQAVPTSIRMSNCGPNNVSTALAAGHYALVAVLGYRLDPLNAAPAGGVMTRQAGGPAFALVSAPLPITVN
jgi:hypothetical protein